MVQEIHLEFDTKSEDLEGLEDSIHEHEGLSTDLIASAEKQIVEHSKKIEYYVTEYTIGFLATKMRNGDFVVPHYHREFIWDDTQRSRFIESVLMGLPTPLMFFWGDPQIGKLKVIDGAQRLRTIEDFVLGDFKLGNLEELSLLNGFRFRDLTELRQRKIKNRSIRGILLNEHSDERACYSLYCRVNSINFKRD